MYRKHLESARALQERQECKCGITEVRYISRKRTAGFPALPNVSEVCIMYADGSPIASYYPETRELYITVCGSRSTAILNRLNAVLTVFDLPKMYWSETGKWYFEGSDAPFDGCKVFHLKPTDNDRD